jgi:hypothetical protein
MTRDGSPATGITSTLGGGWSAKNLRTETSFVTNKNTEREIKESRN